MAGHRHVFNTGSTSLAKSRRESSALAYGTPPKRNVVASSKEPSNWRRNSSVRKTLSGVPHAAAFIKPARNPFSPMRRKTGPG
jgi:hypothetical protein